MKQLIVVVALLVAAAAGWYFLSPLVIDQRVDEALPGFEFMPTRAEVDAMGGDERARLAAAMDEFRRMAPDSGVADPMPTGPQRLAGGNFRDADAVHKGSGEAAIYALPDGTHILRLEDFRVTNGPALVVLLTAAKDPANANEVIDAGYVSLGTLKGNVGSQNYVLPDDLEIDTVGSVVIWCELFDVLFSPAAIARGE